jgi:hypothetical protein
MHFEILVEDQSGKKLLEILVPNLVGDRHTFKVHAYKGLGKIPKDLAKEIDPSKRILLANLPKLLEGYGKTYSNYPGDYLASVIVVCDLDDKCLTSFRNELFAILDTCSAKPDTHFCIAIEEGEAWYLGDIPAIKKVYPAAKDSIINSYVNDSICGTWECLADAVFRGGAQALSKKGWRAVGAEKSAWAEKITPHMNIDKNKSPSFCYFRDRLRNVLKHADDTAC